MPERRQFHRIRLTAKSELSQHDINYQGHLENISLSGALIRFDQGVIVPRDGEYILTVYLEGESDRLRLVAEVVYAAHSLAGIRFVSHEADTLTRLGQLVEAVTLEPDKLKTEIGKIRELITDYLGEC